MSVPPQAPAGLIRIPSFRRFRRLASACRNVSLTRALQYEYLADCGPLGVVLDIGGGGRAKYRSMLEYSRYDSVNIDPSIDPKWVVQVGEPLPVPSEHYETVLSLNTIEHILEPDFVLAEMMRALRSGGRLLMSVPFLMPIHGHPDDYFRPTSSWLFSHLSAAGFERIEVVPLAWGPFSSGIMCSGAPGPLKLTRMRSAMLLDLIYFRFHTLAGKPNHVKHEVALRPLAYFVFATKR